MTGLVHSMFLLSDLDDAAVSEEAAVETGQ